MGASDSTGPRASAPSFGVNVGAAGAGLQNVVAGLDAVAGARKTRQREAAMFAREQALVAKAEYEGEQGFRQKEAQADLFRAIREWNNENKDASPEEARSAYEGFQNEAIKARGLDEEFGRAFRAGTVGSVENSVAKFEADAVKRQREQAGHRINQFTKSVIQEYLGDGERGGKSPALVEEARIINESIGRRFPENPILVEAMRTQVDTEVANTLIAEDPEAAVEFINSSTHIESGKRITMLKEAERSQVQMDAADRQELTRTVNMNYELAMAGKPGVPLTEEDFQSRGDFKAYQDSLAIHQKAGEIITSNAGVNEYAVNRLKGQFADSKNAKDREALRLAITEIEKRTDLIDKDPVRYAITGNPTLKALYGKAVQAAEVAKTGAEGSAETYIDAITEYNEELLRVQSDGDGDYNLNLSEHLHSLLPNEEAESFKDRIMQSDAEGVLGVWQELESRFPDDKHLWIAFEDIAAAGMDFTHIASFYYRDKPWVNTFIEAQRITSQDRKLLPEDDRAKYEGEVAAHPGFIAFAQANLDGGANSRYVASILSSVSNYAQRIAVGEARPMADAIEIAANNMFGESLMVDTGDGVVSLSMLKSTRQPLSQTEVEEMEEFLPNAIGWLDLSQVSDDHFRDLAGVFSPQRKAEFVDSVINEDGNVRLAVDRDQMSIIMIGRELPGGKEFVIKDREGNPFRLHVDDLPRKAIGTQRQPGDPIWLPPARGSKAKNKSNWPFGKGLHGVRDRDMIYDLDI